ncbi:MAG TPA: response regulator [Nitrososphaeraceae archaeon]
MDNLSTKTCYYYYYYYKDKSKRIIGLDSLDPKYYDEIITKLKLQASKRLEHSKDQTASSRNKKKKRILLVDDEPDICMAYQMMLEDAGYDCISYTDSLKALQEFKPYFYDLILLDIKMPLLNGFELCEKVREIDKTVHIVFITASEVYYEKFRSQHFPELGKVNYIQKPIGNEELVQIVNTIIGNSITIG